MALRLAVVGLVCGCSVPRLEIRTPPGAYVFRDGELVGRVPTNVYGDRPLQVYMPGFVPYTLEGKWLEGFLGPTPIDVALVQVRPSGEGQPAVVSPPLEHHLAWILTKAAIDAGRAGDCDTVKTISAEVQRTDARLHDAVFVREL